MISDVEREADGERVLELRGSDTGRKRGTQIVGRHCVIAREHSEQSRRRRNGSLNGAVSRRSRAAATFASSPRASEDVAECAAMQNSLWFVAETYAAMSSRSPTDHSEVPRTASWVSSLKALP